MDFSAIVYTGSVTYIVGIIVQMSLVLDTVQFNSQSNLKYMPKH